jgi:hypothetical protein
MLFDGDHLPQQRARGLMRLKLACENAGPEESWIKESYNRADGQRLRSDRATALQVLEQWLKLRSANATQELRPAPPEPLFRQTPPGIPYGGNPFGHDHYGGDFCASRPSAVLLVISGRPRGKDLWQRGVDPLVRTPANAAPQSGLHLMRLGACTHCLIFVFST